MSKKYRSRRVDFTTNRGAKQAPKAFLDAARGHQFGSGSHKQCDAIAKSTGKPCPNPAVRGANKCRMHRGKMIAAGKGRDHRTPARKRADTARLLDWQANVVETVRNAPKDLQQTQAWQNCLRHGAGPSDLAKLVRAWNNPSQWLKVSAQWTK